MSDGNRTLYQRLASVMDAEDALYAGGALLCSVGCLLMYTPAGFVSLGMFAALPPLVSLFRTRGPQR